MTTIIALGSEIIAVEPFLEGSFAFKTSDGAIIQKSSIAGYEIVDVELPEGVPVAELMIDKGQVVRRPPTPMTDEEATALIKVYDGYVQERIDSVARSFGYGDPNRPEVSPILHAVSYAEEPAVPRFQQEGRALRAWRSVVWDTAAGILNAVRNGQRAIPTRAELLAELPVPPEQEPLSS